MIRKSAAKVTAAVLLAGGLAISPLLQDSDTSADLRADPLPVVAPQFQIRWRQDVLTLSGHTVSRQHERDLLEAAEITYPGAMISTDFKPLGVVPDFWPDITLSALDLLAETRSAEAIISTTALSIRGVVDDELGWRSRLAAINDAVPVEVGAAMLYVDSGVNVAKLCARAFNTLTVGSIEFEEANTVLRSSAYPRLDRVIALANACQQARILITGHTDASGNAAFNQTLSLNRAARVAEYLVEGGIDRVRLAVRGAGSELPIADDSTRHGRSLNRRIEINFEDL